VRETCSAASHSKRPRTPLPTIPDSPSAAAAADAGLRYVTDARPGIRRRRRGRGFVYEDQSGRPVRDAATLERITALAIPPAWTDVWISPHAGGHIQATGRDARGRKQYRYHAQWRQARDRDKYDLLVPFGEALPSLRARVDEDLAAGGLGRDQVLALAVALLDETLARVGNREYARDNGSFGLTTLRDRHARIEGGRLQLCFTGKGGIEHALTLEDRRLARLVSRCREIPGHTLFQYIDEGGGRQSIDSGMVNAYVREVTGAEFTAKCFRTWGGTVLAAGALAEREAPSSDRALRSAVVDAVREVAERLGNTVAVCRAHYIHPGVLDAYAAGDLATRMRRRHSGNTPAGLAPAEAAVLDVLRG
jgi:DNA topoisomerase-1